MRGIPPVRKMGKAIVEGVSKGRETLEFTACLGKGCKPSETGTQVCAELGRDELGHFTEVRL